MSRPARADTRTLTAILLEAGVVTPEQVEAGLVRQRSTGLRIGETLVEMGAVTEEDIGWALARQLSLTFVDVRSDALDRDLVRSFPEGLLHRLDAVPLVGDDANLSVALADPTDPDVVDELERAADRTLTVTVATPSAIRRVLREVLGPWCEPRGHQPLAAAEGHFDVEWERSGASFLLFHIAQARRGGATEIHFLPSPESLGVFHRIGDRLVRAGEEPPGVLAYLLARIEALGGPALGEESPHAAGSIVCPVGSAEVELGASLLRMAEGVSVTLEPRPAPPPAMTLERLGIDPAEIARLRAALESPAGLAVVTGPPRSGGSTTLACLIEEAGTAGRRCLAFGASASLVPPELRVPGTPADAARAWREAAVAQGADLVALDGVLSGDGVVAALAPEAAGRRLLVRTDWTDTFALLERLGSRAHDRAALASRLLFVIQQRLVRVEPGAATAGGSGTHSPRRVVFEVLVAEESLRRALRAGEDAEGLRAIAEAAGFRPLSGSLGALAAAGEVGAAETARVLA